MKSVPGALLPLKRTATAPLVVLGEALVDLFPNRAVLGGAPFNVARNLAVLGAVPHFITRVGDDDLGRSIQAECTRFGLPQSGVQRDMVRPTGAVRVHLQGGTHHFEILPERAWDAIDPIQAVHHLTQIAPRWVYFGTLAQRGVISRRAIREAVNATWAQSFLDLNLRAGADDPESVAASLMLADVVKVNDEELDRLLAWFGSRLSAAPFGSDAQQAQVDHLMQHFDLQRLFVTRGPQGYAVFEREAGLTHQGPATTVVVKDTVGAGDAFASVLLLGELERWPLEVTLLRASAFASAVCTLTGAVSTDLHWYTAWRRAWQMDVRAHLSPSDQEAS